MGGVGLGGSVLGGFVGIAMVGAGALTAGVVVSALGFLETNSPPRNKTTKTPAAIARIKAPIKASTQLRLSQSMPYLQFFE